MVSFQKCSVDASRILHRLGLSLGRHSEAIYLKILALKENALRLRAFFAGCSKKAPALRRLFLILVAGVGFEPADAAGDCLQSPRAERPSA